MFDSAEDILLKSNFQKKLTFKVTACVQEMQYYARRRYVSVPQDSIQLNHPTNHITYRSRTKLTYFCRFLYWFGINLSTDLQICGNKLCHEIEFSNLVDKYQTSGNYFIRFIIYLSIVSFILLPTGHLHFTITN